MNGNRLLDTNIIIAFFKADPLVLKKIGNHKVYIPSIVIGELRFGAEKSTKTISNQSQIDALIKEVTVLPVTLETAGYYGLVKNQLKKDGQPIPENDIWIAAISLENEMLLITRDKHFSNIDSIKVQAW